MDDPGRGGPPATPAMASILLDQGLWPEAGKLLERLRRERPDDPRLIGLTRRLEELQSAGEPVQHPLEAAGADRVHLELLDDALEVRWELTRAGMDLAKRTARCSGDPVVRLFTVTSGPRGARKTSRDLTLLHDCGLVRLVGLPRPAVHVAAAGFLARSGLFLPLGSCPPVEG